MLKKTEVDFVIWWTRGLNCDKELTKMLAHIPTIISLSRLKWMLAPSRWARA